MFILKSMFFGYSYHPSQTSHFSNFFKRCSRKNLFHNSYGNTTGKSKLEKLWNDEIGPLIAKYRIVVEDIQGKQYWVPPRNRYDDHETLGEVITPTRG